MFTSCLSRNNEICALLSEKTLVDFMTNNFCSPLESAHNFGITTYQELLHLNTLREATEMYFIHGSTKSKVCKHIATLSKTFFEDYSWNNVISYLQSKTDNYLVFGATRTISVIMYNFPIHLFEQRLSFLIKNLLEAEELVLQNKLFELLISLLNWHDKITFNTSECLCEHLVECIVSSIEDIFSCICLTLSSYWTSLVDIFLETENPNLNFLLLWKILSEKNLNEQQSSVFLNEDLAVNFLSITSSLPPVALKLYVDIISQIFCSGLKSGSWKCSQPNVLEANLLFAISSNCLNLLPLCEVSSNICRITNKNQGLSQFKTSKINITSKKIIFVIFNYLCEFTNADSLCEVIDKLFEFISTQDDKGNCAYTHCELIDFFIDYDDLLFGVMFASLKIYCKLKDLSSQKFNSKEELFVKKLNPHKTFIKFLQQIGWDHNEILSFLLSEETCCLIYLLWYLKLLLAEWNQFVEAHEFLFTEKYEEELLSNCTLSNSTKRLEDRSGRKLVSYSSSSSSDEEPEQPSVVNKVTEIGDYLKKRALETLSILVNLNKGIRKLVDLKEFPYNVEPLVKLLKQCTDKCVLLT
ncbi:hypothetical protein JTE90_011903 [Oedothorax gibbosus]|uniref:Protein Lines N-terminal domain-containing protein n=1 Tax=Oedothorax gibbosus TaxID=931172 RepID=A0AAV6V241_9ARAC|nr:hypothetical protein JTE90_011903 [Oedothorax gibbosus]